MLGRLLAVGIVGGCGRGQRRSVGMWRQVLPARQELAHEELRLDLPCLHPDRQRPERKRQGPHRVSEAAHAGRSYEPRGLRRRIARGSGRGTHDLVFANYDVARSIERSLQTVPVRPDVVPVISKPTQDVVAEARVHFAAVIVEKMDPVDALEEIDNYEVRRALVDVSGFK